MNGKLFSLIIISLIVGVGVGYSISLAQVSSLQSDYDNLNTTYNNLQSDYQNLETNYNDLNATYYELQGNYSRLDAMKGFVFDETLNVTVKIEEGYFYDTVKGNVTNIGDVMIPKLYVFILIYKADGSLYTEYSRTIENLYPNETNSFDFSSVLDEDYTFKIFAIGNYWLDMDSFPFNSSFFNGFFNSLLFIG